MRSVGEAARVHHVHLVSVYAASAHSQGAYSIEEWAGGVTVADRRRAGEIVTPDEFLPNAAGLAEALAACHRAGVGHGAIDTRSVYFAAAHPAKLGGFGRLNSRERSHQADVAAMTAVLVEAATGRSDGAVAPSQLNTGLSPSVDRVLADGAAGRVGAAELAARLRAAPTAPTGNRPPWNWRWTAVAGLLVLLAAGVGGLGLLLRVSPSDAPALFPGGPVSTTTTTPATTTTTTPTSAVQVVFEAAVYDPFGNNEEEDASLPLLADGDPRTAWRTERYFEPLATVKPGVGVVFTVRTSPDFVELSLSSGTRFELAWSPVVPDEFDGWEPTAAGRVVGGAARIQLPSRRPGAWLLWLTELPELGEDDFGARVFEVRFTS